MNLISLYCTLILQWNSQNSIDKPYWDSERIQDFDKSDGDSTIMSHDSDSERSLYLGELDGFDESKEIIYDLRERANLAHTYNTSVQYPVDSTSSVSEESGISIDSESSVNDGPARKFMRRKSSQNLLANKKFRFGTGLNSSLVFSRGHFLGDVSKMVAKRLSSSEHNEQYPDDDVNSIFYGYGAEPKKGLLDKEMIIHEREEDEMVVHTTTLMAGPDGCVVVVFKKANFIPFLDEYPGTLLSLLGTQVVI